MPKPASGVDVRARIFGAARKLFAHHGYLGTTTRKICDQAGVPLGSLHYHFESNHQGIDNELIDDRRGTADMMGGVERHERLGGMLNYYYRRAA